MLAAVRQAQRWATQALRMRKLYVGWFRAASGKYHLRGRPQAMRLRRSLDGSPIDLLVGTWQDVRIVNELFLSDPYLRRLPPATRQKAQPLVVDVGANRGYFCIQAAAELDRPRVVAYEPEPENLDYLCANLALNGLLSSVEVVPVAALADDREEISLHLSDRPALHTTVDPGEGAAAGIKAARYRGESVTVVARNLDADLHRVVKDSATIDLLKVDTEGTEPELLESLSDEILAAVGFIVAEVNRPADELAAVLERLKEAGFVTELDAVYLYAFRDPATNSPRPEPAGRVRARR